RTDARMLEHVQLTVEALSPIRHGDDVGVVDLSLGRALEEPGADRHPVLPGQAQELLRTRSVDRLRERLERRTRELAHVPVAREAHLGECDDLHARAGGLAYEVPDAAEIVRLVAGRVLKLDRGHTGVAHRDVMYGGMGGWADGRMADGQRGGWAVDRRLTELPYHPRHEAL